MEYSDNNDTSIRDLSELRARIKELLRYIDVPKLTNGFCRKNTLDSEETTRIPVINFLLNLTCTLIGNDMDYGVSGPKGIDMFIVTFDLLLTLPILFGNLLIIIVFGCYLQRDHRHGNIFIVNLAVSDFLVGLMLPYDATFYIQPQLHYHKLACFMRSAILMIALGQSISTLMAISVDRYIAVCHPMKYSKLVTRTKVNIVVAFSWISIVTLSTLPILGKSEVKIHVLCYFRFDKDRDEIFIILVIWFSR